MAQNTNPVIEVAKQLNEGKAPSNKHAMEILEKTKEFVQETKESSNVWYPKSEKLLSDAYELAEATKQFIEKKNPDERLQHFTEETRLAGIDAAAHAKEQAKIAKEKGVDVKEAQASVTQAGQAALNILKLMVKNGEFRMYMLDLTKLFQDILVNTGSQQQGAGSAIAPIPATAGLTAPVSTTPVSGTAGATAGQDPLMAAHLDTASHAHQDATLQGTGIGAGTGAGAANQNWLAAITPERKKELSSRFLALIQKMNSNQEIKNGVGYFNNLLRDVIEDAKQRQVTGALQENEHMKAAYSEAKQILVDFSGRPIDPLVDEIKKFQTSLQKDEKMRQWLSDFQHLLNDVFKNTHTIDETAFVERTENLIERGRQLMQEIQLRNEYQFILSETRQLWESIKNDEDVQNLTQKFQQFTENFTEVDEAGNRRFNRELVGDLRKFLVPLMMKLLENIPVPPTEGSNETYDYRVENIVISGYDIIPEQVEFHTNSNVSLNVHKLGTNKAGANAQLRINNVKTNIQDIHFWFRRKSFPKIEDEGVADFTLTGDGMDVTIDFSIRGEAGNPRFHLENAHVNIDRLKINIKEAKHNVLLSMITSLFSGTIKRNMTRTMEEKIASFFGTMEQGMNNFLQKYPPSKLTQMAKTQIPPVTQ